MHEMKFDSEKGRKLMKKLKKPLSLLLAVIMALSVCTVGFTVLAADRDLSTPQGIQEAILNDYKAADGSWNTEAKLKDDVKAAYAALSVEQKNTAISAEATSMVFNMSYNTADRDSAAAAEALGGYTPKQEEAINFAVKYMGFGKVTIGGKEQNSKYNAYPFNADYKYRGVTYTVADQKRVMEELIPEFSKAAQDPYLFELANRLTPNPNISDSFFYGVYYFYPTAYFLEAMLKYAAVYATDKQGAELQKYVFDAAGFTANDSLGILAVANEWLDVKYQDALKAHQADPGNADAQQAFATLVKEKFERSKNLSAVENQIMDMDSKLFAVTDKDGTVTMRSVKEMWTPIINAYQTLLDKEAAMPVIAELTALDIKTIVTKEDVIAALASYNKLNNGAKNIVNADETANKKREAILLIGNDLDSADFRKMVDDYTLPTEITDNNKEEVLAFVASATKAYNELDSNVKAHVQNVHQATYAKYLKILDLKILVDTSPFINAVNAFDLKAEKGDALNKEITAVKALYTELSHENKTYIKEQHKDTYQKYNQILGLWSLSTEDQHELFTPEKVDAEMSAPIKDVFYKTLIPKVFGIVSSVMPSLTGNGANDITAAVDSLFTNDNITVIVKALYPAIYNALKDMDPIMGDPVPTLFYLTPSKLASVLPEPQFAAAKAALLALNDPENIESWADVKEINWGVVEGDYESFITTMLTSMKGLTTGMGGVGAVKPLIRNLLIGTVNYTPDGQIDLSSFEPGAWDYLIVPLMECLGVEQDAIMDNLAYAKWALGQEEVLFALKPIIDMVYYQVLPQASKDPVDYLAGILPNLVYHLEDGCLIDGVNNALNHLNVTVPGGSSIDLKPIVMGLFKDADGNVPDEITLDMIFNMLAPTLEGLGIQITPEDIFKIGRFGTPERVDTVRMGVTSTVKVTADKDSVINYLMNAVNSMIEGYVDFDVKGDFVKLEAPKYPHNGKMNKDVMVAMINGLDGMLEGIININELINSNLCTNKMAAQAVEGIYKALAPTLSSIGINLTPKDLAAMLTEDKYRDLAADLQQDSWDDVALFIADENAVIPLTNMGFKDNDRQGFIDCIVAILRPLTRELGNMGLLTNTTAADGTVAYGLYETLIIPSFEALGLTPAVDSAVYTANYEKLTKRADPAAANDYLIQTILTPVLDLLDNLAVAPAATLMKLLPNLAYAIQYNPQLAFVGNLLADESGAIHLEAMLNGLIKDLIPGFELPEINLDALASAGTVIEKNSKSALHKTYKVVEADSADAFVTVFYYLYDAMNYKDNLNLLKNMLAGMDGIDATLSKIINTLLNDVFTVGKEEALCKLGALLASNVWECPDGDAGTNGKTPSTGDYAIPAAVFMAIMISAGGVIMLMRKKKKSVI